jgi:hypothetical protein
MISTIVTFFKGFLVNYLEGLGNAYYIAAHHEYALKYCNTSVLENMHAAYLINLLQKPENNILNNLPTDVTPLSTLFTLQRNKKSSRTSPS